MTIRSTVLMCSTMFAFPFRAMATAPPEVPANPGAGVVRESDSQKTPMLRDLDTATEMRRSGKVAVPDMHGQTERIAVVASPSQRTETKVDSVSAASPSKSPTWISLRDDPTLNAQYGEAFSASVGQCRFEVAEQMGVSPAIIEAGVVTFRWTIEPSGKVRDASMVADSPTNEAVMACAKRIVIGQVLLNPVEKPLALEWTYTFHKLAAPTKLAQSGGSP